MDWNWKDLDFKSIPIPCLVSHSIWNLRVLKSQVTIEIPRLMDFEILWQGLGFEIPPWNSFYFNPFPQKECTLKVFEKLVLIWNLTVDNSYICFTKNGSRYYTQSTSIVLCNCALVRADSERFIKDNSFSPADRLWLLSSD